MSKEEIEEAIRNEYEAINKELILNYIEELEERFKTVDRECLRLKKVELEKDRKIQEKEREIYELNKKSEKNTEYLMKVIEMIVEELLKED